MAATTPSCFGAKSRHGDIRGPTSTCDGRYEASERNPMRMRSEFKARRRQRYRHPHPHCDSSHCGRRYGWCSVPRLLCCRRNSCVRHEAPCFRVGYETHPWPPQRLGEAEGSLPWELPWPAGAALTTYQNDGTTRRRSWASKVGRCNASEPVAESPQFVNGSKPG